MDLVTIEAHWDGFSGKRKAFEHSFVVTVVQSVN